MCPETSFTENWFYSKIPSLVRNLRTFFVLFALLSPCFKLFAQCNCIESAVDFPFAQTIICESFDSYQNNAMFPVNNARWAPWPGTGTDLAKIQASPTANNNKALYLQRNGTVDPDVLLKLGNRTSGRYRLSWQMYVPKGKNAYYNIQHEENVSNGYWAFQVEFGVNGLGAVYLSSSTPVSYFPYLTGAWNTIMHIVDLNEDKIELWINNEFVDAWKFSLGTNPGQQLTFSNKLGAINFYANENAEFFVDNICMRQRSNAQILTLEDVVCVKNGQKYYSAANANHDGLYTSSEFTKGNCAQVCYYQGVDVKKFEPLEDEISSSDIIPNSLLNSPCIPDLFPLFSRKQLRGKIYNPKNKYKDKPDVVLRLKLLQGKKEDVTIVMYDCLNSICYKALSVTNKLDTIIYSFDDTNIREPKFVVLSSSNVKYFLDYSYSQAMFIEDCETFPIQCNCDMGTMVDKEMPTNIQFKSYDYPSTSYPEFNTAVKFEGNEAIHFFILETRAAVDIKLNAVGNGVGMFLLGQSCQSPIASSITTTKGGTASITNLVLEPGRYHLYFDLILNRTEGTFTLTVNESPVANLSAALENCPVLPNNKHTITIRNTPLLLDNAPLIISDRIVITSVTSGGKIQKAANWNSTELLLELDGDDPNALGNCGFTENEELNFQIIRGNNVIPVQPVFQNIDQATINATNRFKSGGKSLITGFYSKPNVGYISISTFPRITTAAIDFLAELSVNDSWQITSATLRNANPWYKISPVKGEKGYKELSFSLSANPYTHTRRDTLSIVDAKGNVKLVVLEQPGCTGPSVNAGPDQTLCGSQNINLNASGSGIISWQTAGGIVNGTRLTTTVNSTQTFTAYATINGCTAVDPVIVVVKPKPLANAGIDQTVCAGRNASLSAGGNGSYRWSTNQTSAQINVTPTQTTTYTLTVTLNGCESSDQVIVNVQPNPNANGGPDRSVCLGESVLLTASGGGTYRWSTSQTTAQINVVPTQTITYTLTVTLNGCEAKDETIVSVKPKPSANAGQDQNICAGTRATLTASGGGTYKWSNNFLSATITVGPSTTQTYTVTVTQNGCEASDQIVVKVNPNPVVVKESIKPAAGPTGNIQVKVSGGTSPYSYQWFRNDTLINDKQEDLVGIKTGIHRLVVTDANGCKATYGPELITRTAVIPNLAQLDIFPNPSYGQVIIRGKLMEVEKVQVSILEATGKYIWKSDIKTANEFLYTPDLSNLAPGIYIVQLDVSGYLVYRKFILH